MDADDIMARQVEQLDREKREMQMKLKLQDKRVDHFERAKRLEEIPLLTKEYEEFVVADKEFWDEEQEETVTFQSHFKILTHCSMKAAITQDIKYHKIWHVHVSFEVRF
jgi:hypothetical protein